MSEFAAPFQDKLEFIEISIFEIGLDLYFCPTEGHFLRRQMGLLAKGYHPRREARRRGRGRAPVLPGGPPRYAGVADAAILG